MSTTVAKKQSKIKLQTIAELLASKTPVERDRNKLINDLLKASPIDNARKLRFIVQKFWTLASAIQKPRLNSKIEGKINSAVASETRRRKELQRENARKAGTVSGIKRAEKINKTSIRLAWLKWQDDPDNHPYGNKRGCKKAFDLDMAERYNGNEDSIEAWREQWQRETKNQTKLRMNAVR